MTVTVITVVGLLLLIAFGAVLIHLLNVQHSERIAGFVYGDALPGVGRRTRRNRRAEADAAATTTVAEGDVGVVESDRGGQIAAILRERRTRREKVMRALYRSAGSDRLSGVGVAKLQKDLGIPEQDLVGACGYLADKGWVVVDRRPGDTPATIRLTPQGIRRMRTGTGSAAEPGRYTSTAACPHDSTSTGHAARS
jgi:hypothetical protein